MARWRFGPASRSAGCSGASSPSKETRILEADKALLERTQHALDQCLAWLERDALIDAYQNQQGGRP
jgi:hypothetical protein